MRRPSLSIAVDPARGRGGAGRRELVASLAAAFAYAAGTLAYLAPFLRDLRRSIGPDLGDPRLNLYLLKWGAHQLANGLPDLWSPPFFYPTRQVLALSDHLLGPALQVLALSWFGIRPVLAYNLLFLSSFVFGGWATYWVLRRSGLAALPAFVGGWLFAFAHSRWDEASHLQVLVAQWIPLVLWFFDRLLAEPRPRNAALFLAFYLLQVSSGSYLALMLHLPLAILAINRWSSTGHGLFSRDFRRWALPAGAIAGAVMVWLYAPYATAAAALGTRRSVGELRYYGAILPSFLTPSRFAPETALGVLPPQLGRGALYVGMAGWSLALWGLARARAATAWRRLVPRGAPRRAAVALGALLVPLGLLFGDLHTLRDAAPVHVLGAWRAPSYARGQWILLAAAILLGLGLWRRQPPRETLAAKPDPWRRGLLLVGALSLFFCLPVGFALLHGLPGFDSMRVSHRFFAFALPAVALLAGSGIADLGQRVPSRALRGALLLVLCATVAIELRPALPPWQPLPEEPDFPAYCRWIRDAAEVRAYVEAPFTVEWRETEPMYLATLHWKPLVNGYSAVLPASYSRFRALFYPWPRAEELPILERAGITHIVVHFDAIRTQRKREALARRIAALEADRLLTPVYEGADATIYRLELPATAAPPDPVKGSLPPRKRKR